MIELSIHMPSVFVGFVLGYILISALFLWFVYDDRYHNAFSQGWDCGKKYAEEVAKKEKQKEGEQE